MYQRFNFMHSLLASKLFKTVFIQLFLFSIFILFTLSALANEHLANDILLTKKTAESNNIILQPQQVSLDSFLATDDQHIVYESKAVVEKDYHSHASNTDWGNLNVADDFFQSPYQVSLFSQPNGEDGERLWSQTKSIFAYGFGVIGVIALLPDNISNWDSEEGIYSKWTDNVKMGPVWDRDGLGVNVIGHGYFGGLYYQAARKSGYRQWDAFIYSALMSTFYWEYGIEAFAEIPSIQDLVVTPVVGWAFGEWAYTTEMGIRAEGGQLWGSSFMGDIALIALDPVDSAGVGINHLFGKQIVKAGTGYIDLKDAPTGFSNNMEKHVQLNVSFQLGDGSNISKSNINKSNYKKDPLSTGVIGFSFGTGKVNLDNKWLLSNDYFTEYSVGLYLSRKISARLSYASTTLLDTLTNKDVIYENYNLSGQYYFNTESNLRPYITTGFGETMLNEDYDQKTFQVNAGLGVHYKITNNLAFQLDWRHFHSTSAKTNDDNIGAMFIYRIGNGER